MALQSQAPRATASWRSSAPKSSLLPAVIGLGGLALLVGVVVVFWSRMGGSPGSTPPAADIAPKAAGGDPVNSAPAGTPPATAPTAAPATTTAAPATSTATTPSNTPAPAGTGAGAPPATTPVAQPFGLAADIRDKIDAAQKAMSAGGPAKLLEARTLFNQVLNDERTPEGERRAIRGQMQSINDVLIFSPAVAPNDPLVDTYTIQSGDSPITIVRRQSLPIDSRFLLRINQIADARRLRIGQQIKLVRMPFHAVVHKDEYRMDLYMGPPPSAGSKTLPDGQDEGWTYIRSFPVGLGESNGTPEGEFVVRPKSKLINPRWVNPRTSEVFEADNPKNPIGEYWVGLDGADENTRKFLGYGIHGTIEPDSIGQQRSMGCVRMLSDDVALVWEVMMDRVSTVRIVR